MLRTLPLDATLHRIVRVLRTPLEKRYQCARQSNWRVAVAVLIKVLKHGLPLVRLEAKKAGDSKLDFRPFWTELSSVLEDFLFPESIQEQVKTVKTGYVTTCCHFFGKCSMHSCQFYCNDCKF